MVIHPHITKITGYVGNVYVRSDGLAGVLITDSEYPARTAFSVINKILDEFSSKFPSSRHSTLSPSNTSSVYPELKLHLTKVQDPSSADPLLRVQRELDETKIVLVSTLSIWLTQAPNYGISFTARRKTGRSGSEKWYAVLSVQNVLQNSQKDQFMLCTFLYPLTLTWKQYY